MFQKAKLILYSHIIAEAQWKKGNIVVSLCGTPWCFLQHVHEVVSIHKVLRCYRSVSKGQRSKRATVVHSIDSVGRDHPWTNGAS